MNLRSLFIDTTRGDDPISSNTTGDQRPNDQKQVIDFLTLQSLSFPVASAGVTVVWKVIQAVAGTVAAATWVPIVIAGLIVLATFCNEWNELGSAPKRLAAALIGLVNALLLSAATLGVNTHVLGTP